MRNKLQRFLNESECHVAISLHSAIPEQRAMIMPAEKGMSIVDVVDLLRNYDFTHSADSRSNISCLEDSTTLQHTQRRL